MMSKSEGMWPFWILASVALATIGVFWLSLYTSIDTTDECHKCVQRLVKAPGNPTSISLEGKCLNNCKEDSVSEFWSGWLASLLAGVLITLSVFASLSVIWLKWKQTIDIWKAELKKKKKEKSEENQEISSHLPNITPLLIHAIPFGILNFALLFELEAIAKGQMSGVMAISGIMILFLLAELAAHVITHVDVAKKQAEEIEDSAKKLENSAEVFEKAAVGADIIGPIIALAKLQSSERKDREGSIDSPVTAVAELLSVTGCLAQVATLTGGRHARMLMADMFTAFFSEAKADMLTEIVESSIPAAVRAPKLKEDAPEPKVDLDKLCDKFFPKDHEADGKKTPGKDPRGYAYFASNLSTYTNFISNSLRTLARITSELKYDQREDGRVPFMVTITNHLPTHFFGAPISTGRDHIERQLNMGILRFYGAQRKFVQEGGLIFRLSLVRGEENISYYAYDKDYPLYSEKLWNWENKWICSRDKGRVDWFYKSDQQAPGYVKREFKEAKLPDRVDGYPEDDELVGYERVAWCDKMDGSTVEKTFPNEMPVFVLMRKPAKVHGGLSPEEQRKLPAEEQEEIIEHQKSKFGHILNVYRNDIHKDSSGSLKGMTWISKCWTKPLRGRSGPVPSNKV